MAPSKSRRDPNRKRESKRGAPRAGQPRTSGKTAPAPTDGFPIVAIGASAGGLEAVTEMLQGMPADIGAALVLVQHLDPGHTSILPEILARTTPMPVLTIDNEMPVRPNTVFVIPPNHGLEMTDGRFRLTPRKPPVGRPMPVDQFFRSVAETHRDRVIGVVLSGTNSDGALGLQAIKAEGGITVAQAPETAKFSEMPQAAISEGPVDLVLSPRQMAHELAGVVRRIQSPSSSRPEAAEKGEASDQEQIRRIFALLRTETKVDFSLYRGTTIRRRIARRLVLNHLTSLEEYVALLRRNPREVRALYDDLLITVTAFFRDPATFELLASKVLPDILSKKNPETPIRIWVPGCATGEEAYSLAIALFEVMQGNTAPPLVQIFGTDVSDSAIEKARSGIYLENSLVNVSPDRLRGFFRKVEGGFQISKRIRDVCIFARQNIASDPPFSNIDLLSCRNLLIYLEPTLQRRVLPLFHYALNSTGYLILGSAETLGLFSDLFHPVDRSHRIFIKKPGPIHLLDFDAHRGMRSTPVTLAREGQEAGAPIRSPLDVARESDRIVLGRFAPPGVVVNDNLEIVQFRGKTGPYLEPASGAATFQLDRMARDGLGVELRRLVEQARRSGERVRAQGVPMGREGKTIGRVDLEVTPIGSPGSGFYLVLFEEPETRRKTAAKAPSAGRKASPEQERIHRLERELTATKEYLQSIIEEQEASNEELKSANEEILSSNEELQSTNEELETAKEELQSTNEELRTVNDELQNRNLELADLSNDLVNLFASINIPTVMIGARGEIRRFTPLAEKLLNLRNTDIGRPIGDLRPNLVGPDLAEVAREVIDTVSMREREIQDRDGHWYLLRARPYRTVDNRIDGAVLLFLDIDPLKRSLEQVSRARFYAEALVETVRESLIVLDNKLCLVTANQAFYATFQTTPLQTDGKRIFELDGWEWAEEKLHEPLRAVVERDQRIVNLEIEAEFRRLGRRWLLVNARQIHVPGEAGRAVLLGIEDISERRFNEARVAASERRYRQIFELAREGIWILDAETGEIRDANPFLANLLGYSVAELTGRKPWDLPIYPSADEARSAFEEIRENGGATRSNVEMRTRDGRRLEIDEAATVYSDGGGTLVRSTLREVSEKPGSRNARRP